MSSPEDAAGPRRPGAIGAAVLPAASAALQAIADDRATGGLGAALLAAWEHGLAVGHVPSDGEPLRQVPPSPQCPYTFVHVPVRRFRSDHAELARRGILAADPDPAGLIFHEDALVTDDLLPRPVLDALTAAGRLERVDPGDARIRCTAGASRPGAPVWLPVGRGAVESPAVARVLATRRPCTYCSGAVLNPREATVTARPPGAVRTYRFGFTFAPVGDPRQACHVLTWDAPDDDAPVLDMQPQPFSVNDLVRLVTAVNDDLDRLAQPPVTGVCNHWAGNSIHHQHYQLLRLPEVPLLRATEASTGTVIGTPEGVAVRRAPWPAPAYVLRAASADAVARAAERVALTWHARHPDHTQNLLVTQADGDTVAVVVPRLRSRVDTSTTTLADGTTLRKGNAAVLEMVGYFVIDAPEHFEALAALAAVERRRLVDGWLHELAPDPESITDLEAELARA